MKIAVLSDQHGSLPSIPACDLMIISGDITGGNPHGPRDESDKQWHDWLRSTFWNWATGAPRTIMIAGNHDTAIEKYGMPSTDKVTYLCDSSCEFGNLRFWGAPWVRKWDPLAFGIDDKEHEKKWDMVPSGTNVMVCHGPPFGWGDMVPGTGPEKHHVGSRWLAHTILRVRPKLVTCGHIHEGRGIYDAEGTMVVNSSCGFTEIEI